MKTDREDTPDDRAAANQLANELDDQSAETTTAETMTADTTSNTAADTAALTFPKRLWQTITAPLTYGGLVLGVVFGWQSFKPTLMPRGGVSQAAITALCVLLGYAFGTLAGRMVRFALDRSGVKIPASVWPTARKVLAGVAVVVAVAGLVLWVGWQNDQRDLVGMDHISLTAAIPVVIVVPILVLVIGSIGRLVGASVRSLDRWNQKHLSRTAALVVTTIIVALASIYVLRDVAFTRFTLWADSAFGSVNTTTSDDVTQPRNPEASGSPESLVDWESLGLHGRSFAGGSTSPEEMKEFWGEDAELVTPVRAYVGKTDGTMRDRARLAVRELERAGGFDRSVLVVATTTGSGWIDPDAAEALEMMHRGDTAIVSMQYSFLPSWISFITDLDAAADSGTELFNATYERWSQLPKTDRPKLIVFGLSLGSYGAEFALAGPDSMTSLANVEARTDGVLLVGATNSNPMHRQFVAGRDAGSTVWNPIYDGGRDVQFITRDPNQTTPTKPATWPLVYVQHPSDPVTQWGFDWLWSPSAWNDRPRGYDVPDTGGWFPVVTWVQGVFDLMAGFGAPPGFGHDYRLDYVNGWSRVVPPDAWTVSDTKRLEAFLAD